MSQDNNLNGILCPDCRERWQSGARYAVGTCLHCLGMASEARVAQLEEIVHELIKRYGQARYHQGQRFISAGVHSWLADAFAAMGYPDPMPIAEFKSQPAKRDELRCS